MIRRNLLDRWYTSTRGFYCIWWVLVSICLLSPSCCTRSMFRIVLSCSVCRSSMQLMVDRISCSHNDFPSAWTIHDPAFIFLLFHGLVCRLSQNRYPWVCIPDKIFFGSWGNIWDIIFIFGKVSIVKVHGLYWCRPIMYHRNIVCWYWLLML